MSINIPEAVDLNDQDADTKIREVIGSPSSINSTKNIGNIPRTYGATQYVVSNGTTEGAIFNFDESGTNGNPSLDSAVDFDVSIETKLLVGSWQFNAPNRFEQGLMSTGGTQLRIVSGTGIGNYRDFVMSGIDAISGYFQKGCNAFVIDMSTTPDHDDDGGEVGTFDDSNVEAYGMYTTSVSEPSGSSTHIYLQRVHVFDTDLNGTNILKFTSTSNFDDLIDEVLGVSKSSAIGNWVQKLSNTYFIPVAFQIGDDSTTTNFNDNGVTVISPSTATATDKDPRYRISTQGTRVYCRVPNSAVNGTCELSGTYVWGVASPWDFDNNNDGVIALTGTYSGMGQFTMGSSVYFNGTTNLSSGSNVVSNGANLDSGTIKGDCDIVGSSVTDFVGLSVTGALDFDTSGTYTLSGCTINEVTNSSGGAVIITIDALTTITTNTGPSITVNPPLLTLTVSANVTLLGAEVRIYDYQAGTGNDLGTELDGIESAIASTFSTTSVVGGNSVWVQVLKAGRTEYGQLYVMPVVTNTLAITLSQDGSA